MKGNPMSKAYIIYRGEKVEVEVESTFQGVSGLMANVKAVNGYPFLSSDVQAQGKTSGSWNCNGYRVRADFVQVEQDEHAVELAQRVEREIDWQIEADAQHADWLDNNRTMEDARF